MNKILILLTLLTVFLNSCSSVESNNKVEKLTESIGIETMGGVSLILIPKGTKLPTSYTQVFSTSMDNQDAVLIHLLKGSNNLANDNTSIGKFQINGIRLAPKGEPQIEVRIAVDLNEEVKVFAKDLDSGTEQSITIIGQ